MSSTLLREAYQFKKLVFKEPEYVDSDSEYEPRDSQDVNRYTLNVRLDYDSDCDTRIRDGDLSDEEN